MVFALLFSVKTRTINNVDSARVSVPAILVPQNSTLSPVTRANNSYKYRWRTPLRSTVPYWKGMCTLIRPLNLMLLLSAWFTSLSSLFLSLRTARLLVLAGTERLDTPLTIGQMQGKFWLEVMNDHCVGHLVHEVTFILILIHLRFILWSSGWFHSSCLDFKRVLEEEWEAWCEGSGDQTCRGVMNPHLFSAYWGVIKRVVMSPLLYTILSDLHGSGLGPELDIW